MRQARSGAWRSEGSPPLDDRERCREPHEAERAEDCDLGRHPPRVVRGVNADRNDLKSGDPGVRVHTGRRPRADVETADLGAIREDGRSLPVNLPPSYSPLNQEGNGDLVRVGLDPRLEQEMPADGPGTAPRAR